MNWFLRIKHWQLFLLMIGIPLVSDISFISIFFEQDSSRIFSIFLPIIMIIWIGIFFGWFYALGTNLHKKLPPHVKMNLRLFKVFWTFPVCYIFLICLVMMFFSKNFFPPDPEASLNTTIYASVFVPVHLFAMFCIFYCLYFIAKTMKAVEWQRPVTFSDYAGEFFLLWFYPVGIWFIQPRINRLFEKSDDSNNKDLFLTD